MALQLLQQRDEQHAQADEQLLVLGRERGELNTKLEQYKACNSTFYSVACCLALCQSFIAGGVTTFKKGFGRKFSACG